MGAEVSAAPAHRLHHLMCHRKSHKKKGGGFKNPLAVKPQQLGTMMRRLLSQTLKITWMNHSTFYFLLQLWCEMSQKLKHKEVSCQSPLLLFCHIFGMGSFQCNVSNCFLDNKSVTVIHIYINLIVNLRNTFCYWIIFLDVRLVCYFSSKWVIVAGKKALRVGSWTEAFVS